METIVQSARLLSSLVDPDDLRQGGVFGEQVVDSSDPLSNFNEEFICFEHAVFTISSGFALEWISFSLRQ